MVKKVVKKSTAQKPGMDPKDLEKIAELQTNGMDHDDAVAKVKAERMAAVKAVVKE